MDSVSQSLNSLTSTQKQQLMDQMRSEVALASAKELLEKCVGLCMDRYVDTWNLVSKTFASRIKREADKI